MESRQRRGSAGIEVVVVAYWCGEGIRNNAAGVVPAVTMGSQHFLFERGSGVTRSIQMSQDF